MARAPRHQRTARSSGVAVATTLAVVVVAVGVVAYFHFHHAAATSSTTTLVTTTTLAPAAPLTGLPDPARQAFSRPALTVKVENTPEALPQWGIDRADVVYEEIVDGGITRLAAIFNSQAPAKVGPVRSVRPTDVSIVDPIKGIFAYSGGAPYAINDISAVPGLKLEDETTAGAAMYRDPTRQAPHNLYASAGALFNLGGSPAPPTALFTYSSAPWRAGVAVSKFTVDFPSIYAVAWTWNASTTSWDRTLFGQPIVTGTGVRVSAINVVVMYVDYLG
ncbi:MAG: DUF3048 domain-containing protein, partial [Acidimicrobiales bacterium]